MLSVLNSFLIHDPFDVGLWHFVDFKFLPRVDADLDQLLQPYKSTMRIKHETLQPTKNNQELNSQTTFPRLPGLIRSWKDLEGTNINSSSQFKTHEANSAM